MTSIFKSKTCEIKKKNKQFELIYEDGEKFSNFYNKIKKNLTINKEKKDSFVFEAFAVERLKDLLKRKEVLSYRHLKQLFTNIGKQLEGLEEDGFGNLFLNIDNIVRVEIDTTTQGGGTGKDVFFLYLDTSDFSPIKDKTIKIIKPFKKDNLFFSPEMKKVKSFPIGIPNSSQYYSLALLTCYCGKWSNKSIKEYKKLDLTLDKFREYLSNIENTSLYFSLLRCLRYNPEERVFLYI